MDKYSINRYARQIAIPEIGIHGQKRIAQSSVLIVGIGGLGCPVGLYLAAAGVGKIGLVDNDIVSLSNLQRQILFVDEHIGHPKVHIAQQILIKHNPNLHIDTFQTFLNEENASTLIEPYDLVIDCCDNFATRYIIDKTCRHLQKIGYMERLNVLKVVWLFLRLIHFLFQNYFPTYLQHKKQMAKY